MHLFYNSDITNKTKKIEFSTEESRHIVKVLRKKINDTLLITNGLGCLFTAVISTTDNKKCIASITKIEKKEKEWNYHLHIAIAPTKNMNRLEWFVEKATEIGIDEITPVICNNSERKILNTERLIKVMLSALKQSLKLNATKINQPVKYSDFLNQELKGDIFIAHCCYDTQKKALKKIPVFSESITIFIGPEGDFSANEIEQAIKKGAIPVTLGNTRLRTETAALTALQYINFLHQ